MILSHVTTAAKDKEVDDVKLWKTTKHQYSNQNIAEKEARLPAGNELGVCLARAHRELCIDTPVAMTDS